MICVCQTGNSFRQIQMYTYYIFLVQLKFVYSKYIIKFLQNASYYEIKRYLPKQYIEIQFVLARNRKRNIVYQKYFKERFLQGRVYSLDLVEKRKYVIFIQVATRLVFLSRMCRTIGIQFFKYIQNHVPTLFFGIGGLIIYRNPSFFFPFPLLLKFKG